MRGLLSQLFTIYKVWLQVEFEYRVSSLTWVVNGVVGTLFVMFLWLTVSRSVADFPMSTTQIVTYFLLAIPVGRLTQSWSWQNLEEKVKNGDFTIFLLRPLSYLVWDFGENLSRKTMRLATLLPVGLVVYFFLRGDFGLTLTLHKVFLFVISLLLGTAVRFFYENFMGVSSFWLINVYGISSIFNGVSS